MPRRFSLLSLVGLLVLTLAPFASAQDYTLDQAHMAFYFRIKHVDIGYTFGRFNEADGAFSLAGDNSKFAFTVKTDSIDTGIPKRDDHLRSPDYFNTKQYPVATFTSTKAQAKDKAYVITGDLTLYGTTKPVTLTLALTGQGKDPWGNERVGLMGDLTIKRSDFKMPGKGVGDEVHLMIAFEGLLKK